MSFFFLQYPAHPLFFCSDSTNHHPSVCNGQTEINEKHQVDSSLFTSTQLLLLDRLHQHQQGGIGKSHPPLLRRPCSVELLNRFTRKCGPKYYYSFRGNYSSSALTHEQKTVHLSRRRLPLFYFRLTLDGHSR